MTSTPQQFGEYLLFRRLTTDGLGESYRAGKIGSQGIERVVLLRLFNGQGTDPDKLWRTIADRMGLHRVLHNPHIGDGADVGRVGTTPYVAYEYVSGKNLAELLAQARSRSFQIPTEHALFIMERVTFGLSAAFSTRHRDQRIQHGFVVPENVLLSNEGEVRLIGFESGPGLREFLGAAPVREGFGAYLAPEVKPGTAAASTDDVFSLGSLLYELLTGKRLPHPPDGNFDPLIDDAILASEDKPLPPALRALLKSSLMPKAQRIGDVQQWQQAFGRFIAEADYKPTTFNLAFFMHTLFGGEIEQESVDIAREKATQVDVAALTQAQPSEPAPGPSDTILIPPTRAGVVTDDETEDEPPAKRGHYGGAAGRKKTNWKVVIPLAVLAIAAGLAAAYYMSKGRTTGEATLADLEATPLTEAVPPVEEALTDGAPTEEAMDVTAEPAAATATTPPAAKGQTVDRVDTSGVAVPATPEEVEAQIRKLVDDRANTLEARYEDQLAALRTQLEEARAAQDREAERPETGGAAAGKPAAQTAETTAGAATTQPPAQQAARPNDPTGAAAAGQGTNGEVARQPAAPTTSQAGFPAGAQPATGQTSTLPASGAPAPATQAVEPAKPAPKPVAVGDLVEPGPGVTPPRMTQRPSPRYPPSARRLGKEAVVQLRLLVDENGRVERVENIGKKEGFGFDDAAVDAANRTAWKPATKDGVRVKMWVDLKIEFRP